MVLIQNLLHLVNICGRTYETMSDEIYVFIDGEMNIALIFLGQCRQVDMLSWHIDALVGAKHTVVLNLHINGRPVDARYLHANGTIVEKNNIADLHILGEIGIRDIDDVVSSVHLGTAEDLHGLACLIFDRLLDISSADFGAFGINKDTDMRRNGTRVLDNTTDSIRCSVCRVHPDNVHPGIKKATNEVDITTAIAD